MRRIADANLMKKRVRKFEGHFICRPFFSDELFADLEENTSKSLARIRTKRRYQKNDTVVSAGDVPDFIFILNSGQARLSVTNGINSVTNLRLVKKDEILGLNEVLANSFCEMNVETVTICEFDCVRRRDFLDLLSREPEICYRLLNLLGLRTQQIYETFSSVSF